MWDKRMKKEPMKMDAEQDAHFQLMKRLLVIIPLSTILILLILCVVLGVNLYEAKRELQIGRAHV